VVTVECKIRVRYDEVDKMGYVYHGNYAKYYHISRTELLREVGICDKTLEKYNILLPVIEMTIKYKKPVYYDDVITIETTIQELPSSRMKFNHKVFNPNHEIINEASSAIAFVNSNTRRPMKVPKVILNKLTSYANSKPKE
jgi:acyl-CoA thioester hydrolase